MQVVVLHLLREAGIEGCLEAIEGADVCDVFLLAQLSQIQDAMDAVDRTTNASAASPRPPPPPLPPPPPPPPPAPPPPPKTAKAAAVVNERAPVPRPPGVKMKQLYWDKLSELRLAGACLYEHMRVGMASWYVSCPT